MSINKFSADFYNSIACAVWNHKEHRNFKIHHIAHYDKNMVQVFINEWWIANELTYYLRYKHHPGETFAKEAYPIRTLDFDGMPVSSLHLLKKLLFLRYNINEREIRECEELKPNQIDSLINACSFLNIVISDLAVALLQQTADFQKLPVE